MQLSPEQTIVFRPEELFDQASANRELSPDVTVSPYEPSFWLVKEGILRKKAILKPNPVLRLGTNSGTCDIEIDDPMCSDVQIAFVRTETCWLVVDCGLQDVVSFGGLRCRQALVGFGQTCFITAGRTDLLFASVDRTSGNRTYQAIRLKHPMHPLDLENAALSEGVCELGDLDLQSAPADNRTDAAGRYTIGRSLLIGQNNACDTVLTGEGVSPVHALLFWGIAGVYLEDLGGQYGTTLDEKPLTPRSPVRLADGARIGIGATGFMVKLRGDIEGRAAQLAALRTPQDRLRFSPGASCPGETFDLPLEGGPIVAGRGEEATFLVPDECASRKNTLIEAFDKGAAVQDLDSANGTVVNGHEVTESHCVAGDILLLGQSGYLVHYAL